MTDLNEYYLRQAYELLESRQWLADELTDGRRIVSCNECRAVHDADTSTQDLKHHESCVVEETLEQMRQVLKLPRTFGHLRVVEPNEGSITAKV